tara:strand:+ start:1079 stop:1270 length:192 start_codon:yes stop_codon:yes gene_type:complete
MKVVITPTFSNNSDEELLQINDVLAELKEDRLIDQNTTVLDFKITCLHRGLNEYRKDLRLFDC